ncbi:SOS response-associated peptidase [Prauserella flavalba]|uniref:Abasic site processing protein n=1 Tax=Prauserella flavalba TaxID=1477506 RepID=A0A318LKX1_9PSEU|nr:SOS response-associated peptidase [Prauserella flavalba]PXY33816.1 hypothetical protein BA062_16410 [Prauserella flavalba]
MCGRYAATKDPATLMKEFDAADGTEGHAPTENYNVAPTKNVISVVERHPRDDDGNVQEDEPAVRSLRVMRWGLVPFWAKDAGIGSRMINTRAETATEKPAFRKALSRRRCLIPADGWYEWRVAEGAGKKAPKEPFFMTTRDGSSLAFAGIWETWRDPKGEPDAPPLITCSVITTDAIGQLTDIHDRMPLVMPRDRWRDWLDPDRTDASSLLEPPSLEWADSLELRPVSTKVNSVRNNGPGLLERVETEPANLDESGTGALFELPNPK